MVEIRQIEPHEWQLLRQLRLSAVKDSPSAFADTVEETEAMPQSLWQGRAQSGADGKESFCVIALEDSYPVGIAVGLTDKDDSERTYLVSMWVAVQHRGTTVALSLLQNVTDWASSTGAKRFFAGVKPGNDRAAQFYKKHGFNVYSCDKPEHAATRDCDLILYKEL